MRSRIDSFIILLARVRCIVLPCLESRHRRRRSSRPPLAIPPIRAARARAVTAPSLLVVSAGLVPAQHSPARLGASFSHSLTHTHPLSLSPSCSLSRCYPIHRRIRHHSSGSHSFSVALPVPPALHRRSLFVSPAHNSAHLIKPIPFTAFAASALYLSPLVPALKSAGREHPFRAYTSEFPCNVAADERWGQYTHCGESHRR